MLHIGERAMPGPRLLAGTRRVAYPFVQKGAAQLVKLGVPSQSVGYRGVKRATVPAYLSRKGWNDRLAIIHPASRAEQALPENVSLRSELPGDPGWWGYSFQDVAERFSAATFMATIPDCRIGWYHDESLGGDFFPAIVTRDGYGLDLREIRFRERHIDVFRNADDFVQYEDGIWFAERVYDNHSHWLTAHLPKLLLLKRLGLEKQVLMPAKRTGVMNATIEMIGHAPDDFKIFDLDRPLAVRRLTVMSTDRFRPKLVRLVPQALGIDRAAPGSRRIFISRAGAERRRLLNEDELWPVLKRKAFERVRMEELSFAEQVALMRETGVLCAPHGAGLTNMMFCPPGTKIIEMADPAFPNPNFYALAAALGHRYWYVKARSVGEGHPLEKDLQVSSDALSSVLERPGS